MSDPAAPTPRVTDDQLIDAYVNVRDASDVIKARHQTELAPLNEVMAKLTAELDSRLARAGAKSVSCPSGTAMRVVTTQAVAGDWSAVYKWVVAEDRFDVFPKKLNSAPFTEMLATGHELPPGVRIEQSARVQVRRRNTE